MQAGLLMTAAAAETVLIKDIRISQLMRGFITDYSYWVPVLVDRLISWVLWHHIDRLISNADLMLVRI